MAAVFLLLQVQAELNEEIYDFAFDLGRKLVEQYFNDELQVISLFHTCKNVLIEMELQVQSKTTCTFSGCTYASPVLQGG